MATIDNLNFGVILDDADFKQKVQNDIQLAKDLNIQLTQALNVAATRTAVNIDNSQAMGQINSLTQVVNQFMQTLSQQNSVNVNTAQSQQDLNNLKNVLDQILQNIQNINGQNVGPKANPTPIKQQNAALKEQSAIIRQLTTLAGRYFSVMGATRFLSTLVDITGEFEVQRMALKTILGDAEKAEVVFEKLRQFAVESPYTFQELAKYTKQLAAFDIPTDRLLETNKMLADVAAGLGVSMDRLILAYGHVKSSGFLRGMQLRQFTQNGVPILEQLSDILSEVEGKAVSVGEVFEKMTKRQIDFSMVEEAFRRMTSEGGKFYQMQEVLVDTLKGKIGKFKDTFQQAMYDIGESQSGALKWAVDFATKFVKNLNDILKFLSPVIVAYGTYTTCLLANLVAQKAIVALNFAKHLWVLVTNLNRATAVMRLYGMSLSSVLGVVGLVIAGILELVDALSQQSSYLGIATQASRDYAAQVGSERAELKSLIAQLDSAEAGTKKFNDARDKILSKYGNYLSNIDKENIALGKTAGLYEKISENIREVAKQKFLKEGQEELTAKYQKQYKGWMKIAEEYLTDQSEFAQRWGKEIRKEIEQYIYGDIKFEGLSDAAKSAVEASVTEATVYSGSTIRDIRNSFLAIQKAYEDGKARLEKLFDSSPGEDNFLGPFVTDLGIEEWRRMLNKALSQVNKDFWQGLDDKPEEDWYAYQKRISARYKELMEQIQNAPYKEYAKEFQEEVNAIKELDAAFKGQLLTEKATKNEETEAERIRRERIKTLTTEINVLNKLRDAYEKLTEYTDDAKAKGLMHSIFDESLWGRIDSNKFAVDEVTKLINELEGLDPNKAESLRAALGNDGLTGLIDTFKAAKQYQDYISKWQAQDFTISGRGFEFDVNKIVRDYNTAVAEVMLKTDEAVRKAKDAYANDPAGLEKQISLINQLRDANIAYLKVLQQDKIDNLASAYVKDAYSGNLVNLRNLGGASMARLDDLIAKIDKLKSGVSGIIPEDTLKKLEAAGIDVEKLKQAISALFQSDYNNLLDKKLTKVQSLAKSITKEISSVGDAFAKIGGQDANGFLSQFNEILSFMTEFSDIMTESFQSVAEVAEDAAAATKDVAKGTDTLAKSADWVTMAIKLVALFAKNIANAIAGVDELAHAVAEAAEKARRAGIEKSLSDGVKSIFGEDQYRSAQNAIKVISDLRDEIGALQSEASAGYLGPAHFWDSLNVIGQINELTDSLSGLENVWIRKKATGFLSDPQYISLLNASKELGVSLYDTYGHLNAELVDAILNTYKVSVEQEEWLTKMKNNSELYIKAVEQVEQVMSSLFGQIADQAADKIIDSWIEAGRAALDYVDILDDVAKAYAKMVLKSAILNKFFDDKKAQEVADYFMKGEDDRALAVIQESMQGVANAAPVWEKILQAFDPYFKKGDESGASSLGESIKNSINEEQANLIASYVNAMRADLSFMRGKQTQYIDYMLAAMPTLSEHVASIDAHTYDIMLSNAAIAESTAGALAEMRSIIGSSTGLPAVRVEAVY